jgi:hypothetical protein
VESLLTLAIAALEEAEQDLIAAAEKSGEPVKRELTLFGEEATDVRLRVAAIALRLEGDDDRSAVGEAS